MLGPTAFAANGFSVGVTAGEITPSSAILWAKTNKSGRYFLAVEPAKASGGRGVFVLPVRATAANDNTVQRRVKCLKPGTRYRYVFTGAKRRRREVGTFVTAPAPQQNATVEFAFTGDTDFSPEPDKTTPYWNNGQVFRQMQRERNDFNVHFGDTIYSDSEVRGALQPIALTVEHKSAKYKLNLRNRHLAKIRGSAGFYSHWDDHEFVNDFSPVENTFSNDVNINGRDLQPQRPGLPRLCPRHLQPRTWDLPLFPLGAQRRDLLPRRALLPLGDAQFKRFTRAIKRSKAPFKVIMNELPIQQYYALPYDRWEGYEAERQRMLNFLSKNVKNVIFLTTDVYATLVNDARFQTLEPGGPRTAASST